MSATRSFRTTKYASDHFEPEGSDDPQAQRRLRGQLEQIDFTAFACNREVVGRVMGKTTIEAFQRLALAAATARADWAREAVAMSEHQPSHAEIAKLGQLRTAFEELSEAYEGLRRMVERGYLTY